MFVNSSDESKSYCQWPGSVSYTQIAFGAARGRNTVSDENLTWKDAATLPIVFGEFPAP